MEKVVGWSLPDGLLVAARFKKTLNLHLSNQHLNNLPIPPESLPDPWFESDPFSLIFNDLRRNSIRLRQAMESRGFLRKKPFFRKKSRLRLQFI